MIIDSRGAGLGDAWMRLAALYSLAALRPSTRHTLLVTPALVSLARDVFGARCAIATEGQSDVRYTHLGLRHALGQLLTGARLVFPFYWLMRAQRRRTTIKDRLNDAAILAASTTRRIVLPAHEHIDTYQGYMELQALRPFRAVRPREFAEQARRDLPYLQSRLRRRFGMAAGKGVLVFPSGTAHQVMPPGWAARHLGGAVFAFHASDPYAEGFSARGLRVARFTTPEEMLQLGHAARRIFVTDSFPSHLWQCAGDGVVVLLSQQPRTRVVHPGFPDEQVVASRASCCPCRNRDRGNHLLCDTGREYCSTWESADYAHEVAGWLK
jgi:hypothetical protein